MEYVKRFKENLKINLLMIPIKLLNLLLLKHTNLHNHSKSNNLSKLLNNYYLSIIISNIH